MSSNLTNRYNVNDDDNDDREPPRQILLPIGGGIVGKLASSVTNLSHSKSFKLFDNEK